LLKICLPIFFENVGPLSFYSNPCAQRQTAASITTGKTNKRSDLKKERERERGGER